MYGVWICLAVNNSKLKGFPYAAWRRNTMLGLQLARPYVKWLLGACKSLGKDTFLVRDMMASLSTLWKTDKEKQWLVEQCLQRQHWSKWEVIGIGTWNGMVLQQRTKLVVAAGSVLPKKRHEPDKGWMVREFGQQEQDAQSYLSLARCH